MFFFSLFLLYVCVWYRGRVRSGVRLLGATVTDPSAWNISIEVNPRHTGATVTVLRKEPQSTEASSNGE